MTTIEQAKQALIDAKNKAMRIASDSIWIAFNDGNYLDMINIMESYATTCEDAVIAYTVVRVSNSADTPADTPDTPLQFVRHHKTGEVILAYVGSLVPAMVKAIKQGFDFPSADLRDADLRDADLSNVNLRDANLSGADLSGADLSGANLRSADCFEANLSQTVLTNAALLGAELPNVDLSGADLSGADLRGANLSEANLEGAILAGVDITGANLSGIHILQNLIL